jgi:AraC-like DNA-binding protein
MTLEEIKQKVRESYYMEDDTIIDVAIACIIANRLQLGDPTWLVIIGASSGGKSQILRPLAMTDRKYIHQIDDLTENTFLSGGVAKGGKDISFLNTQVGKAGMLSISDLTVLFSRNAESRNAILSQFRMLYDGEMTKRVGNKEDSVHWKGYIGVIAGSTPSIYSHMEDVADMGERFMYFRMKPYDERKATKIALSRKSFGRKLDEELAELYGQYIVDVVRNAKADTIEITEQEQTHIIDIAILAEKMRTVNKIDKYTKDIERIPTPAMPMRTALQITNFAKALKIMRGGELSEADIDILYWLGFSLANEEKRAVIKILCESSYGISAQTIADQIGLSTPVIRSVLQNLASTKVIERNGDSNNLTWQIKDAQTLKIFERMFGTEKVYREDRKLTAEEDEDVEF